MADLCKKNIDLFISLQQMRRCPNYAQPYPENSSSTMNSLNCSDTQKKSLSVYNDK